VRRAPGLRSPASVFSPPWRAASTGSNGARCSAAVSPPPRSPSLYLSRPLALFSVPPHLHSFLLSPTRTRECDRYSATTVRRDTFSLADRPSLWLAEDRCRAYVIVKKTVRSALLTSPPRAVVRNNADTFTVTVTTRSSRNEEREREKETDR